MIRQPIPSPSPAQLRTWASDYDAEATAQRSAARGWDADACAKQAERLRSDAAKGEKR